MIFSRIASLAAVVMAAAVSFLSSQANAQSLTQIGPTTKICQLTGDVDWTTGAPTAAKTLTNYGLDAVDLGFPVEAGPGGPLYFLFGDSWPTLHPPGSQPTVPPDDALGVTTRTAVPDKPTCLNGFQIITAGPPTPTGFQHPTVTPPIQQGSFNVPSGGVFADGSFYGFFWTNHCLIPSALFPNPGAPLTYPLPSNTCAEIFPNNSIGRGVIAVASPSNPIAFTQTVPLPGPAILFIPPKSLPNGFTYATAAVPPSGTTSIPVFGAARYRASSLYLAMAPVATFGNPMTWTFYGGMSGGNPVWLTRAQWEGGGTLGSPWNPPMGAEIFVPPPVGQRCVGEHSVTWNAPLGAWLLLYNCVGQIQARAAYNPWGPWSQPVTLLSTTDPAVQCVLIMKPGTCAPSQRNYWAPFNANPAGFFYAPFVMNRFTQNATQPGQPPTTQIYWLVSTWNPYEVSVVTSTLELTQGIHLGPRYPIYHQIPLPPATRIQQPGVQQPGPPPPPPPVEQPREQ